MTIADAELRVREWLSAAAEKRATPGGGSAAALAGALAAAMGEMTLNYSTGRKANSPQAEQVLREHLAELTRARSLLLKLMEEDQAAYLALTAARKLDEADPQKPPTLEAATLAAIRVPQAIVAAGMSVLHSAGVVAEHANRWLLSDLAVCGELALATVRCGSYNVKVNLGDLPQEDRARLQAETDSIVSRAVGAIQELLATIERRTAA